MKTRTGWLWLLAALCGAGCATEFEARNALQIAGELPPPEPAPAPPEHAQEIDGHIVIDQKIQFAHDSSEILRVSYAVLDDVVKVMADNAHIERVRVEGHASDEGHGLAANAYNKVLSDRRARAVMDYLVSKGIDRSRLESAGHGVEQPIAGNDSEDGREANRRVEFRILSKTER